MNIKNLLCALFLVISLAGCSKDDPTPQEAPVRTVLVYMIASNLGGDLTNNIDAMISVATPDNLNGGNLLVLYSKNEAETELFQIKQGDNQIVTRHHIRDYNGQSGISPSLMQDVIQDVITDFPAKSYGLVLSSHGTSWLPNGYSSMLRSFGEENGKRMEIYELAEALPDNTFDFILFDACSMGGIECVFELKDKADYIVASPSEVLSRGFPFDEILPYMFTERANVEEMANSFYTFYKNYSMPFANVGVTKTSELGELAAITREILQSAGMEEIYALPLSEIQTLSNLPGSATRLYDFDDLISHLANNDQYTRFQTILNQTVVAKYTTDIIYCTQPNGSHGRYYPVEQFSGLSIYPPQEKLTELNAWYKQLKWYKTVY